MLQLHQLHQLHGTGSNGEMAVNARVNARVSAQLVSSKKTLVAIL